MAQPTTQRIENLQTQIQQLEKQRKELLQRQKEADRKARTKRLIERGAILESLVPGAVMMTNEQVQAFLEKTITTENANAVLREYTQGTV